MTTTPNTLREDSLEEASNTALVLSENDQLRKVLGVLEALSSQMENEAPISSIQLKNTRTHLGSLTVLYTDNLELPLVGFKQNFKYWQTIHSGTINSFLGMTVLPAALASRLIEVMENKRDSLNLRGLITLDSPTAQALAKWSGEDIILSGLPTLDTPTATALAQWPGVYLDLSSLTTLDAVTAHALVQWKGDELMLVGLTNLDPPSAQALAHFKGLVYLTGPAQEAYDAAKAQLNQAL